MSAKLLDGPPPALPGEPMLPAIIYPKTKKVGCVLLQAAVGGSSAVSQMFPTEMWEVGTLDGAKGMRATAKQWQWLADTWAAIKAKKSPKRKRT